MLVIEENLSPAEATTLEAMVAMLDARESDTGQHSIRVRDIAVILARKLGVSGSELDEIARGALLHDIGKIAIPDAGFRAWHMGKVWNRE